MDIELDFEKRHRLIREIIETIALTVLMFLLIRMAFQNFNVQGVSMASERYTITILLFPFFFEHAEVRIIPEVAVEVVFFA